MVRLLLVRPGGTRGGLLLLLLPLLLLLLLLLVEGLLGLRRALRINPLLQLPCVLFTAILEQSKGNKTSASVSLIICITMGRAYSDKAPSDVGSRALSVMASWSC